MPIVKRDANGKIVAVYEERRGGDAEELPRDHPEVIAYLAEEGRTQELVENLVASDTAMARVTEDLVEVLIKKNLLMLTDLPEGAREKLLERRGLRDRMSELVGLIDEDDVL